MEAKNYSSELNEAQQRLKQKETDFQVLDLAKNQLLEENEALHAQLEAVIEENMTKLEALEQDRYSLNLKLSQHLKMADSYQEEIDCLRSQMASERLSIIEQANADHTGRHAQLKKQINVLRADLEASQASEYEKAVRVKELEVTLHHMQLERESRVVVTDTISSSDELDKLMDELSSVMSQKDVFNQECNQLRNVVEQMKAKIEYLSNQLRSKDHEAEENECRATSYYNTLEKTRVEVQELKMELEIARMEANSTKKKGNSLFAEVEDRRVEAEKELVSVRVQNASLKRQLELLRQNLHQMKMQAAALLQMTGSRADSRHVDSLTQQLSQATGDLQMMTSQYHASLNESKSLKDQLMRLSSGGSSDDANYIQYLQALIDRKETVVTSLQQDLQTKRLVMLAESEKLKNCERRLYESEQQAAAVQSQNVRLQLQLDELKMKYEPAATVTGTLRRVKVERIPKQITTVLTPGVEVKETAAELESSQVDRVDLPEHCQSRISVSCQGVHSELDSANSLTKIPLVELDNSPQLSKSIGGSIKETTSAAGKQNEKQTVKSHQSHRVKIVPLPSSGTKDDPGCKTQ